MKRDTLLAYITVRLAAWAEEPLPDLAVPFLKCVGERGHEMSWYVRNAEVVLHRPHTVAAFNEAARGGLGYYALLELLDRVSVLNEITIFVPRMEINGLDLDEQLIRSDFTPFEICIDLRDSTEWIFFSNSPGELARAAAMINSNSGGNT